MNYRSASIDPRSYIAPNATILGDVHMGRDCTVLFNAVLRADCGGRVFVGEGSNIQENACVHVPLRGDTVIGSRVTVGHGAILHGCTIGDGTLVGMGALVIDGARIGSSCLIGAGSLVTGTADIPDGMMVLGSPAKAVRPLTEEERASLSRMAEGYIGTGRDLAENGLLALADPSPSDAPAAP